MEQQAVWAAGQEAQKRAARERALAEEQQMSDIMLAQVGRCDLQSVVDDKGQALSVQPEDDARFQRPHRTFCQLLLRRIFRRRKFQRAFSWKEV
jgi:hypothetical protein